MAIERGEIYFVNLNPVQGREQAATSRFWFCP
jgi:mRNA-degrading endonuclease toxin of MazEF toxin-antitoxin module